LESRHKELRKTAIPIDRIAVILRDSLTGDILYRLLAGVSKQENDADLKRLAGASVGEWLFGDVGEIGIHAASLETARVFIAE
jgi:hypothetical protein